MTRTLLSLTAVLLLLAFTAGCYVHTHTIGSGAAGMDTVKARQWYALWGLVPINQIDTKAMSASATDYNIRTEHSFIDVVIGFFTGWVTVYPKTVTVTK